MLTKFPMMRIINLLCWKTVLLVFLFNYQPVIALQAQTTPILQDTLPAFEWRNVGPARGGRVTAVYGVTSQPNLFYMGATGGGVWKTENYGLSWQNISDGYFATGSIGAIAIDQNKPEIIYVGTGSDGIRSNVVTGKGMYKSVDAGKTWDFLGLEKVGQIGAVEIHPENSNIVYVSAIGQAFGKNPERGVYRTKDGGESWEQILFLSDSVGSADLELAPNNPDIIYASMWRGERKPWTIISGDSTGGIFKSTDGGDNWEKISKGLPNGLIGKIDFAVSADKPERVWALIEASDKEDGLYKSENYGKSWQHIPMPDSIHKSFMYRPFYFNNLDANPQNADNIWSGTKDSYTTYDGGKTWKEIKFDHADHHDLWINPKDTTIIIAGNDGGATISRDGGKNWSTQNNQPTAELYQINVDDQYPFWLYAGQQDNTTIMVPSKHPYESVVGSTNFWKAIGGCETGPVVPKPGDPNLVYASCKGKFGIYNHLTGEEQNYWIGAESLYGHNPKDLTYRFQRVTPMHVSPHNPNIVYYGSQYIHKTDNNGKTWVKISPDLTAFKPEYQVRSGWPISEDITGEEFYSTLYAIAESPVEEGVIWTGSNDGPFYLTKDGGNSWTNVTPPDLPPGGRVKTIDPSPHNPAKVFYAVYRFLLDDWEPYIYKTEDYGQTWERLTNGANGIPADYPTRAVREDPDREGLLYAGTDFGMYISFNDGETWHPFQSNLPVTPITDIKVHHKNLVISTMGRSFWILEDISPLHTFKVDGKSENKLFKPHNTYGEPVNIYYTISENSEDKTLTFQFRQNGKIVNEKTVELSHAGKQSNNGLHVIRKTKWDLHYSLPIWNTQFKFAMRDKDFDNPKVSPGTYEVSMVVGGKSYKQYFDYNVHPNLIEAGISKDDLQKQEALSLKVVRLILNIEQLITELETELNDTNDLKRNSELSKKLQKLKKEPRRYAEPQLLDHAKYLYEMITTANQAPGQDAYDRYEELLGRYKSFIE